MYIRTEETRVEYILAVSKQIAIMVVANGLIFLTVIAIELKQNMRVSCRNPKYNKSNEEI